MPRIEIDPPQVTTNELLDYIAPRLEASLAIRNNFFELALQAGPGVEARPEKHYGVSKSVVLPSDFLPDEAARVALREEHQAHLAHLRETRVDADKTRKVSLMGNLLTERNLPQYIAKMTFGLLMSTGGKIPKSTEPLINWQLFTWTPEEHFHINVLRDGGTATGELDLRKFDRKAIKLQTTQLGVEAESLPELWAYLMP